MEILTWILSLDSTCTFLLAVGFLFLIFFMMAIFSAMFRETLDSHFDKYTVIYLVIFLSTVLPLLLISLYKFDFMIFMIVLSCLIGIPMSFMNQNYRGLNSRGYRGTIQRSDSNIFSRYWRRRQLRMRRREALKRAKSFISPYKKIFGKMSLSNKHCKIIFSRENKYGKFFCMSKKPNDKNSFPFFEAKAIEISDYDDELFNSLCFNFSFNTQLESIKDIFNKEKYIVDETNYKPSKKTKQNEISSNPDNKENKQSNTAVEIQKIIEKININEATEAELTALPGINIIAAKKVIKHRDYNGEFKSVDELIKLLKIKPHFASQLKEMLYASPIKSNKREKGERILDLE